MSRLINDHAGHDQSFCKTSWIEDRAKEYYGNTLDESVMHITVIFERIRWILQKDHGIHLIAVPQQVPGAKRIYWRWFIARTEEELERYMRLELSRVIKKMGHVADRARSAQEDIHTPLSPDNPFLQLAGKVTEGITEHKADLKKLEAEAKVTALLDMEEEENETS